MKIDEALKAVVTLYIDTAPVIYFIEANPQYDALVSGIFQRLADGRLQGITSAITLCEVLVHPLAHNDKQLEREYTDLLLHSINFQTVSVDTRIAAKAAEFRAHYNLRTPDALQVAAALEHRCEAILTNDATMKRLTQLRVLVLDELEL